MAIPFAQTIRKSIIAEITLLCQIGFIILASFLFGISKV